MNGSALRIVNFGGYMENEVALFKEVELKEDHSDTYSKVFIGALLGVLLGSFLLWFQETRALSAPKGKVEAKQQYKSYSN
jgi:hypothetical protein